MRLDNDRLVLRDEDATLELGAALAALLEDGTVVHLQGELGAGKTTLCRGILRALGVRGAVKSPTFTLVEPYDLGDRWIYHFDLYRLADPSELEYIGIDDYFGDRDVCLVEWPERGEGFLPDCDLEVTLDVKGEGHSAVIRARSEKGERICRELASPDGN